MGRLDQEQGNEQGGGPKQLHCTRQGPFSQIRINLNTIFFTFNKISFILFAYHLLTFNVLVPLNIPMTESASATLNPTEYFRVKLRRGLIGLPARFKDHVRALQLRHTHQKSYLEINALTMGNILKVKELVEVKKVKGKPVPNASYWAKGYSLLRRI